MTIEKLELFPKEIYAIEQFLSYDYYYETVKLWEDLIKYAEGLLDQYSAHLAPDHRSQHLSHQADYVWGTIVLPNYKTTLHHLLDGLEDLKNGFLPILRRMSSIRNDIIAQGRDYPNDWMDLIENGAIEKYKEKESLVLIRANNIYISSDYSMQWGYRDLLDDLELAVGLSYIKGSVNYKLNNTVMVKTGEQILQTGIYRSTEPYSACKLFIKEKKSNGEE